MKQFWATLRACLKSLNTLFALVFFRHTSSLFLDIHKVCFRQIAFVWRKNTSTSSIFRDIKQALKRYITWLLVLLIVNCFFSLLLWLSNAQAFQALVGVILLWSLLLFTSVLVYTNLKEKKKQKFFQTFITNPDVINEERLVRAVSQQEGEQIHLLASVLRNSQLGMGNLAEELRDYEEYVESWAHEAKTPLSLLTMILDNRADEIPSDI